MEAFADFLRFREQLQEAFEHYHTDASSLTIDTIEKNNKCLIGRVVWKSPLVKVGKQKSYDALHFTLMDANCAEITGTAWAAVAIAFDKVLETDRIYKFTNAVAIGKASSSLNSRLVTQSCELRFSGLVQPERIKQDPYPRLDHSTFRTDYDNVKDGEIAALVGVHIDVPRAAEGHRVVMSNGPGRFAAVQLSNDKFEEFKTLAAIRLGTVVGFYGVKKCNAQKLAAYRQCVEFVSFDDTVIIRQPDCRAASELSIWYNQCVTSEVEEIS